MNQNPNQQQGNMGNGPSPLTQLLGPGNNHNPNVSNAQNMNSMRSGYQNQTSVPMPSQSPGMQTQRQPMPCPSPNTTGYQTRSPAPGQMAPGMPRPNNPNQPGMPNHGNFGPTNMNQPKMGNQIGNNMGFPQNPGMTQPNVASQHINNMVGN